MQTARSFGVTHSIQDHHQAEPRGHTHSQPGAQDALVGVVSIAKEHLDMAPESLLSIAANRSLEGEVIRLSSWPDPSVTALKVTSPGFTGFKLLKLHCVAFPFACLSSISFCGRWRNISPHQGKLASGCRPA